MKKQVNEIQGCDCPEWRLGIHSLILGLMKADELGIKCLAQPWLHCPWCGSWLKDQSKISGNLFFDQSKTLK